MTDENPHNGEHPDGRAGEDTPRAGGRPAEGLSSPVNSEPTVKLPEPPPAPETVAAHPPGPRAVPGRPPARRYRVCGQVAQGGMGVIFRVWDEDLHRLLAMKVIRGQEQPGAADAPPPDPHLLARFLREAEVTGQLDHPGVVPVHEIGTDERGRVYFTMRLVQGQSLGAIFQQARQGAPAWTQTRILDVFVKVCETLAFAHSRGVIHRDLKPENIMVGRFGETYVMDWGLAKVLRDKGPRDPPAAGEGGTAARAAAPDDSDGEMTQAGAVIGTPAYMPPEQADGRTDELDGRSDVYSVGAMLYKLLTGCTPYSLSGVKQTVVEALAAVRAGPPTPVWQVNPRVSPELAAICEKAMARDKAARYPGMREMADDLRAYLENRVVRAYQTGALAELKKWVVRNRAAAYAGAAAILLALGGLLATLGVQSAANRNLLAVNDALKKERDDKQEALTKEAVARGRAVEQQRRAEGLYLARQSSDTLPEDPALALLLGVEAARRHPSALANNALLSALGACREERTLLGHTGPVGFACWSPDGRRVLTAGHDGNACVWDAATGRRVALLVGHTNWVQQAAFSPDGRRVVTASYDGTAAVWDADSGARRLLLEGHAGRVLPVTFSPDGRRVATGAWDGTVRVWDARTGRLLRTLSGHSAQVRVVAFSPHGKKLLTAAADRAARLWDADSGKPLAELRGHQGGLSAASFSADGRLVLTAAGGEAVKRTAGGREVTSPSADLTPRLWDAETGKLVRCLGGHAEPVYVAAFSRDGRQVVTGGDDRTARVWDVGGERAPLVLEGHDSSVRAVAFSPDGRQVAVTTAGGKVWWWDARSGKLLGRLDGHQDSVGRCAFSPNGTRLLTASVDGTARLWRADSPLPKLDVPGGPGSALEVSADGKQLLTRPFSARVVQLWGLPAGKQVAAMQHDGAVSLARFSPDGARVCTISDPGTVRLWPARGGTPATVLKGTGPASYAAFSADGKHLLVLSPRGRLATRWDVRTGALLRRLDLPRTPQLWASPDGRFLLAWSEDTPAIQLWDTAGGRRVALLKGDPLRPGELFRPGVAFSPDGRRLLTWSAEARDAHLWDAASGAEVAALKGHTDRVHSASFSADSRWAVTSSYDGTARVWDAATGARHARPVSHAGPVHMAVVGPGGKRLVTRSADYATRLWDLDTGESLALLGGGKNFVMEPRFSADGKALLVRYHGDTRVALWDAERGTLLLSAGGHRGAVTDAVLTPDGRWVITAAADRTARLWPADPLPLASRHSPRDLTPRERDRYQVGTPEERAACRHDWEQGRARDTLRLLLRALRAKPDNPRALRDRLRSTLRDALAGLDRQPAGRARRALDGLADVVTGGAVVDAPCVALLAEKYRALGEAARAEELTRGLPPR